MMDPVVKPLIELLKKVRFHRPAIPFVSTTTGRWITDAEAADPQYWARHLREPVRFADAVGELFKTPENILLEVGPGQTLSTLAGQHPAKTTGALVIPSFSSAKEPEAAALLNALGRLWLAGTPVDWPGFYRNEKRRRVPLPTYPFERKRFWIEPAPTGAALPHAQTVPLPAPVDAGPTSVPAPSASVAPAQSASRKEHILAILTAQFQELSGANLADVGPSASFMEMGLDSLFLGQALGAIEKRFGVSITFRQMFGEISTLNDLADYLDRHVPPGALANAPASPAPAPISAPPAAPVPGSALDNLEAQLRALTQQLDLIRRGESPAPVATSSAPLPPAVSGAEVSRAPVDLPLTEQQRELWLAARADADASRAFNQVFAIHLAGRLGADALGEILQQLVNRHDALRTTFASDGSTQRISPSGHVDLLFRDLSSWSDQEQKRELAEILAREDRTPFDLVEGPLFRSRLIKFAEGRYAFIFAAHHIILDGWSLGVFLREFSRLYEARERGTAANLEPAMQFRDYAEWQGSPEQRAAVTADEAYWLQKFSPVPPDLDLPTDRPRPPVKTYRVARKDVLIDAALYESLKQAAAAQRCTLFVYLLAALKAWMFRLTGAQDLVVGIAAAGQLAAAHAPGHRQLMGHCVNTLPLRSRADGQTRFSDHLQAVQNLVLEAYEHQDVTLGTLVRKLDLRTDPSRAPLIPVVFNLGRVARQVQLPGAHVSFPPKAFGFFDLNIDAHDSGRDIHFFCHYNADLFDETGFGRMLDHFRTILAATVKNPGQKIAELPLLAESERAQILVDWNRTQVDFPRDRCAHELIEDHAARTPGAVALLFAGERLTYGELDARANRLARHLQKLGVGPEVPVGLCLERSLEVVIALLGILKAGGAYVPLDPTYPSDRLAFLIEDSGTNLILTRRSLQSKVPAGHVRVLCLDAEEETISRESPGPLTRRATPENLAYVIYTSGSTGRPKGVLLEHRGLCNLIQAQIKALEIHPGDRVLQFSSISFDASVWEIFGALGGGATLCLAEFEKLLPGPALLGLLRGEAINVATLPPSALNAMAQAELPALKTVVSAGEACTLELAARWGRGRRFINAYGPTETTVCATYKLVDLAETKLTIGRPIANTEIYILDGQLQPVPVGMAGELHIGGIGLARGYHRRPELTAEKFIAHPFSRDPKARLYKTGDLARYLPDGNIEYLGRLDHQVKIRGFRVELGEIEEVLNQLPGVQTSVVIAREDSPGDQRLVAYVVSLESAVSAWRESLRARLPDYMLPAAFVVLKELPLTPNGKVDRKALPKPDLDATLDRGNYVAPNTATERVLAAIWSEVLGVKQVGLHDNFFELGGHSLLAVRVINRINKAFSIQLPMPVFFRNPSVAELAPAIDRESAAGRAAPPQPASAPAVAGLITYQAAGTRPPLFFLHGDWTGGGFYCGRLSQELGEDQPFFAIPPYSSENPVVMTIEEMAKKHVAAIQTQNPHGPYLIGGYCIGAAVALEVARQLIARGEQVLHLLLVDPTLLNSPLLPRIWPVVDRFGDVMKWDLPAKIRCFDRYGVASARWLARSPAYKIRALGNRLGLSALLGSSGATPVEDAGGLGDEREILDSLDHEVYMIAYRLYRLKPLSVPITVYLPEETPPSLLRSARRIREIFPTMTVETVPGDHRSCVSKHTSALVAKMKKTLGRSDLSARST
jgi:amino acid adenylation domain-containing protein